jgi:hypothetical protein
VIRQAWGRLGRARWIALWVLAALAVPLAIVFALVAVDVFRTPAELASDDRRFQTSPARLAGLWDVGYLPGDGSERLLGLEDDVFYRELAGLYLKVEPGRIDHEGSPELESMRAKAQYELTRLSREERDPVRQSRLLTLYGVMTLDDRPLDKLERETMIRKAISAFRNAIDLDPTNVDAKTNLEAALSVFPPVGLEPSDTNGGANFGPISGQSSEGTGY